MVPLRTAFAQILSWLVRLEITGMLAEAVYGTEVKSSEKGSKSGDNSA